MSNEQTTQSTIAADVEITGTLKSSGSIHLHGKLDGELVCSADAVIGKSAVVKGNIQVNSVVIEGTINGNVTAKDKIDMKSTAKILGDIVAKRLSVEDGVTFIGRSEVNPSGSAMGGGSTPKPADASAPKPPDAQGGQPQVRR
ncbi:MAG TPA: polymer-forming cytoskeletal protein [Kiritimatiellia bacterium]|nr:polymer-forming cytoskeletal protein [Kiritimatiellia bacterium]